MITNYFNNKESFKKEFINRLERTYAVKFNSSSLLQKYETIASMVRDSISDDWFNTKEKVRDNQVKKVYYFSMEFLMGRLFTNNIMNLGYRKVVEDSLNELELDYNEIENKEYDIALGTGGLGRLAACFLDSLASLGYAGNGNGLRYRYGMFEQKIVDGYQTERPEKWLNFGNMWEVRRDDLVQYVKFGGRIRTFYKDGKPMFIHKDAEIVKAVPYDIPIIGDRNGIINTLRIWSSEVADYIPIDKTQIQYYNDTLAITDWLYPDDSNDDGKTLRLKQQYFLSSAGVQHAVNQHRKRHGDLKDLNKYVVFHINDTHPTLVIPELMRVLIDEENMEWEQAWEITTKTCAYTNHTILVEALERWPLRIFKPLLPRIYQIIEEISRRNKKELIIKFGDTPGLPEKLAIIGDNEIRMAHLCLNGSFSVNGVAELHTKILKEVEMKEFNEFYPNKFNNKTNGITHRRWLYHSNPELTDILNSLLEEDWVSNINSIEKLLMFKDDESMLNKIYEMKQKRKKVLAETILAKEGISLDINSIFDVQVKRLHEYKRQLLNALHIMYLYNKLKEDENFRKDFYPQTFIFGAKAAPSYHMAKKIIKLINSISSKVNSDNDVNKYIKVVFVENYNVSYAELIMPSADISEQISTASKEASGTGNMKLMMNGAVTIGTLDGANVEIRDLVGDDNIFIFGMTAEEVNNMYVKGGYDPREVIRENDDLHKVLKQLVNNHFEEAGHEFQDIYNNLLLKDPFFVIKDFDSYVKVQKDINKAYKNREKWLKMSLTNIAKSGYFSTDRTIQEYIDEIWHLDKI